MYLLFFLPAGSDAIRGTKGDIRSVV